jgi:hypothetical protein
LKIIRFFTFSHISNFKKLYNMDTPKDNKTHGK